jgi:hypothetical protein
MDTGDLVNESSNDGCDGGSARHPDASSMAFATRPDNDEIRSQPDPLVTGEVHGRASA